MHAYTRNQRAIMMYSIAGLGGIVLILCAILVGITIHKSSNTAAVLVAPVATTTPAESPKLRIEPSAIQARAAIVFDATTGNVLYAKNAELPLPLASLTKVMTLYTAASLLEAKKVDETFKITITDADLAPEGSWGFGVGQTYTFQDLADATIVASANDAAQAIARGTAGSVSAFVSAMNTTARALNLTSAKFDNPSGLDTDMRTAGGYASALDVANLFSKALTTYPDTFAASRLPSVTVSDVAGSVSLDLANTNKEVLDISGIRISKTGYTDLAGGNLAVTFDAGLNQPIVVVVLGSTQEGRFADVATLIEAVNTTMAQSLTTR